MKEHTNRVVPGTTSHEHAMSTALIVLDQRSPRGAAHDRAPPSRRASVDVRQTRAHPRSREGFLVRLCTIALLVIIYK